MRKKAFIKKAVSLLLASVLTFAMAGCSEETPEEPGITESLEWQVPQLNYGVLECDKLEVLPWYSGRCEATSSYQMAETKDGYYMSCDYNHLLYGDKVDMCLWVPVCNKADCAHTFIHNGSYSRMSCNAFIGSSRFFIRNGRIWYDFDVTGTSFAEDAGYRALLSMAPDGTDKKVEVTDSPVIEKLTTLRASADILLPGMWLYNVEDMTRDGSLVMHCYLHDGTEWKEYATVPNETGNVGWKLRLSTLSNGYGDMLFSNAALSENELDCLRFTEDGYEVLTVPALGGYASGDIFRYYRLGDGYYDYNLKTGQEVRLADARMENGYTQLLLPNCIVESTLLTWSSCDTRSSEMIHSMEIFDGQQWHTVALPSELQQTDSLYLLAHSVTSDSILFLCENRNSAQGQRVTDLYRIDLTQGKWVLEHVVQMNVNVR